MRFHAVLQRTGKTTTGFEVPPDVVAGLGAGKRPPVRVTFNGYTYRTTVAPMGGAFWLGVSAEHRAGAGVAAGDAFDIDMELDTEPREVSLPDDFMEALSRDADARRFFDGMSYSNKRRLTHSIEDAKTADTRQRRIAKVVDQLRDGRI